MNKREITKWILSPIWIPIILIVGLAFGLVMLFTLPMALYVWIRREPFKPKSFWEYWFNFYFWKLIDKEIQKPENEFRRE